MAFKIGDRDMIIPHPFPYQGSKRNIAKSILRFFPDSSEGLIEPFAGSCAVSIAAAFFSKAKTFILNDSNIALMSLWDMIIKKPRELATQYRILWIEQQGNERSYYDAIRKKFNKSHNPAFLLYLLARCVKGSIRYNSNGEFNQSPDNRRKGMHPDKMEANIYNVSELFTGKIKLLNSDYKEALKLASSEDIVYMDPPYQGVCNKRDPRYISGLTFSKFVDTLNELNNRNISFILSYDGRTGNKTYGKPMPKSLSLHKIEINAGPSTQATLLGKRSLTHEALYLSPALIERLKDIEPRKLIHQPRQLSLFEYAQV